MLIHAITGVRVFSGRVVNERRASRYGIAALFWQYLPNKPDGVVHLSSRLLTSVRLLPRTCPKPTCVGEEPSTQLHSSPLPGCAAASRSPTATSRIISS